MQGRPMPSWPLRHCIRAAAFGAIAACGEPSEPLIPGKTEAVFGSNVTAIAGSAVAASPALKVTTAKGTPLPGISVVFSVKSGGGSIVGAATTTTDASGVASIGGWALGTTAGINTLAANTSSLPEVTYTATGVAGPASKLGVITPPSASVAARAVFATQPAVQVQDFNGNPVTGAAASVTAGILSGGGTLGGTLTVATVNGVATFTNLSIAGTVGARTLTFSSSGLIAGSSPPVAVTVGPAASVAISAGNDQTGLPGSQVPIAPAVRVADADGNAIAGFAVSFAVASGGGSVTGAGTTTDAAGIATVGSWTLGPSLGANTLAATAAGLTGSPVTISALAINNAVTTISPATLTSGATATIGGAGFSSTPASNAVTIDGVSATVTAATATSLTVTVPTLPCTAAHDAVVSVAVSGGAAATKNHPVQAATLRSMTAGQSLILATAAEVRCNELSNTGGVYYLSVYNTNPVYSTTGAAFELKGTPGAASIVANANVVAPQIRAPLAPRGAQSPEDRATVAHLNFMERSAQFLNENGRNWRRGAARSGTNLLAPLVTTAALAVGDPVQIRLPNINLNFCRDYLNITGRVAYLGTKSLIVEDNANALAGTIDSTYTAIGSEYDAVMAPILEANFGNPIANDAVLDNNGRIVMVFTRTVSDSFPGIAGFVSPCDFFQRTTYASSNQGEFFYATAPKVAGNINVTDSPPRWRWSMRGTIIHEVKHIVSTGERFSRNGGTAFEVSWLEETTARLSEELYERARYNFQQRANLGYGSASNQVGPYCGVRLGCNQARGIVRVFEELGPKWYAAPHDYSPLGRINSSDFSFYATGWSLVRWALDASSASEASILKGMTQEPTKTGVANFDAYMGITLANALPKWTLAMALDDYPGFTPTDTTLKQPSWDLRNVFAGYKADFPNATFPSWPLFTLPNAFGAFSRVASVRPGTAAIIDLTGTQTGKQVLELKASGSSAAAPSELRMAIVRVF